MATPASEQSVFLHAIGLGSPAERAAYLDDVCRDAPGLRAELDALLAAHDRLGAGRLDQATGTAGAGQSGTAAYDPPPVTAGAVVGGRYKLLEEIGEGGMGTVWLAEQTEPVRRRVAVKLIKPGMDSRQVVVRFEAERQALALMDHPNIAKVLDGGVTEDGRPFFVMELVKGTPITKHCDEKKLPIRDRLELFADVCRAVQHAHQKGIIHRDLKPSNVMIAPYDGKPVVKVIDFGVAKATGQKLTEATLFTGFGAVVGTPEYMSPEQAELNNADPDTRSDIYSLGVLLYELLTGTTPLTRRRVKEAALVEVLRVIREEEAPRPSTRLSTTDGLPSIAAVRGIEPAKLSRLVRGELDWIALKALEKDRDRRYETANGFAADVQRHLAGEAVQAVPPSAGYRLRKFARRNRRAVTATAVLAVAVLIAVAAVAGSVGWASRDRTARQAAVEHEANLALNEAERWQEQGKWPEALSAAKRAEGLLAGGGSDELRDRARRLRTDLEMALRVEEIPLQQDLDMDDSQRVEEVRRAYAAAFADYGLDVLGLPCEEAAALIRARPGIAVVLIAALDKWAGFESDDKSREMLRDVAHAADSDLWLRQVREARKQHNTKRIAQLAASADLLRQPPTTQDSIYLILRDSGEREAGIEVLRRAQRQHPGDFWLNFDLAVEHSKAKPPRLDEAVGYFRAVLALRPRSSPVHNILGNALSQQNKLDDAIAEFKEAIELNPTLAPLHGNLGNVLLKQNKPDDAMSAYKDAIRLDPNWSPAHVGLGVALKNKGLLDDAIASYREAIRLDHKYILAHRNLAAALHAQQKLDEAVTEYLKVIELDPNNAPAHNDLGSALQLQNKLDDAIAEYKKAIELAPTFALACSNLGNALQQQNKLDDAIVAYKLAIKYHPNDASTHNALGTALQEKGQLEDAVAAYEKAIELDPKNAIAHNNLGKVLYAQKKMNEAGAAYRKAIELDPNDASAHYGLGNVLFAQNHLDEAVAEYKKAIELDTKNGNSSVISPSAYRPSWAYGNLGLVLRRQSKLDDAIACYKRAIELDPNHPNAYINLGNALRAQKKLDEAIASFRKAIEIDPNNALAYYGLSAPLRDQKRLDEAAACLRRAIELNPTYVNAHLRLGQTLFDQQKVDEAIACYKKVIELDPKNALAYNDLGIALKRQKKLDEAIVCFRKAIELDPKLVPAHYNLGVTLHDQNKLPEAVACYRKVIELDPKNVRVHFNLGNALKDLGKLGDAIASYKKAIELNPKYIEAHNNLGVVLARKGLVADAIASYREAIRLEPEFVQAHRNWAWLVAAGPDRKYWDGKRAVELATRVGTLAPKDDRNWCLLGAAHYRAGNWKEALADLEMSIEVRKGGQTTDWFLLAMVEWQLGKQEEARKWYDQAVARMDKNKVKDELSRRLQVEAAELLGGGNGVEVAPPPREKK